MATIIAPSIIGQTIFTIIKIWIVLIPLLWVTRIEKKVLRLPIVSRKQIASGIILGLIMFAAIALSYFLIGRSFIELSDILNIIALAFYTQNWLITLLGALGVLLAGMIWSFSYRNFGFWTCYISHILADIAIAIIGWHLLFA